MSALLLLGPIGSAHAWPQASLKPNLSIPQWGYRGENGPGKWADLAPEYRPCRRGERQSPVDLRAVIPAPPARLAFHYRSTPLRLANDGRRIWGDEGSGSYLMVGNRRYELVRYQFHTPSEHLLDGRRSDMEIQLEHRDHRGRIAMLAVFVEAGRRTNTTLRRVADHLPPTGETYYGRHVGINPLFMLPTDRSYFAYPGSLTTPPCTEGVEWLILREPVELDARLVGRFRQAMGPNARPIQPRNGRPIALHRRR